MALERREILLIIGVIFVMVGVSPFLSIAYGAIIAIITYFGVSAFVKWRKKQIKKAVGEGICAICGAKITENKCPNCDTTKVI